MDLGDIRKEPRGCPGNGLRAGAGLHSPGQEAHILLLAAPKESPHTSAGPEPQVTPAHGTCTCTECHLRATRSALFGGVRGAVEMACLTLAHLVAGHSAVPHDFLFCSGGESGSVQGGALSLCAHVDLRRHLQRRQRGPGVDLGQRTEDAPGWPRVLVIATNPAVDTLATSSHTCLPTRSRGAGSETGSRQIWVGTGCQGAAIHPSGCVHSTCLTCRKWASW